MIKENASPEYVRMMNTKWNPSNYYEECMIAYKSQFIEPTEQKVSNDFRNKNVSKIMGAYKLFLANKVSYRKTPYRAKDSTKPEGIKTVKTFVPYEAKVFETVQAKITSNAENIRLINLRKDFEQLIDNRREWIINYHLKLRELHKHPLYKAKVKIEGKIRQHKNFMEAVEKYHLRDTAIKQSKTADIAKKLEVSTKNHNVKKQILWLQWTMADNALPKLLIMLDRYKKAIEINDSYQEIMTDIRTLRNENKLFTREKKQFEQVFFQYKVFDDVAAWEYKGQRHKIILMYPKLSLDKT